MRKITFISAIIFALTFTSCKGNKDKAETIDEAIIEEVPIVTEKQIVTETEDMVIIEDDIILD